MKYIKLQIPSKKNSNLGLTNEIQCISKKDIMKHNEIQNRKLGISVRFKKEELSDIDEIANFNGLDRSALIRMAVLRFLREQKGQR